MMAFILGPYIHVHNVDQKSVNNYLVKRFTNGQVMDQFRPTNNYHSEEHVLTSMKSQYDPWNPLNRHMLDCLAMCMEKVTKLFLNDIYIMELSALCRGKA